MFESKGRITVGNQEGSKMYDSAELEIREASEIEVAGHTDVLACHWMVWGCHFI